MSETPNDEGFPAALIRAQAEILAKHLENLHRSVESNNQEEIQKYAVDAYKSVEATMTHLRIIRKEIKHIAKAQLVQDTKIGPGQEHPDQDNSILS